MNRTKLKNYAPQARRDFIQAVTDRAAFYGLTEKKIEPITENGDVAIIGGRAFPRSIVSKRNMLEARIAEQGFARTMEAMAYTWFNRLVAIRYMELHAYLDHGYRVLSHPDPGKSIPAILEHAEHVDLPGLKKDVVIDLKLAGDKESELYRLLLTAQCNALNKAMPFLFEKIDDETELLLPDNLLHTDSLIRKLVGEIDEEDWQEVEIIGWLYQFYISARKDEVIGKVVSSEDIPAATQLFTPNWIVKYLVQNTLGRQWLATYPHSAIRQQMEYYIEPAEQTPEVQEQLKAITPTSLNPEELTLLDPACGSGHILVDAYDLFKAIYQERGYRANDIPALILQKNLFGLEIDERAAQLATFALMMKARADDRRIFDSEVKPTIVAIQDSKGLNAVDITHALNSPINKEDVPKDYLFEEIQDERDGLFSKKALAEKGHVSQADVASLVELFENAKTFGSLIQIPTKLAAKLPEIKKRVDDVLKFGDLTHASAHVLKPLLHQARLLAGQYDAVAANPPYLNSSVMSPLLKSFVAEMFPGTKSDLFAVFIERNCVFVRASSFAGFMTPFVWMFLKSYESLRKMLVESKSIASLIHPEYHAFFDSAFVPICAFVIRNAPTAELGTYFDLSKFYGAEVQPVKLLEALHDPSCRWRYTVSSREFSKIPGQPIAYWANERVRDVFSRSSPLSEIAEPKQGLATGDNDRFLRLWHEVDIHNIGFGFTKREDAQQSAKRWFPCNKGGPFRKWYGNNEYVVNWHNDGAELRAFTNAAGKLRSRPQNMGYYFKEGITWSTISSSHASFRHSPAGSISETKGAMCFVKNAHDLPYVMAFLNSRIVNFVLRMYSPTLDYHEGPVGKLPIVDISSEAQATITSSAVRAATEAKQDWNDLELSWEFQILPILRLVRPDSTIDQSYELWKQSCLTRRQLLTSLEEENNRLFIKAYGLQDELSPEVPDDQITLYRPDRAEDIKRLLSYAIGAIMGRYSLDKPGLIYAHSGNQGFDLDHYKTFRADDDGIVPMLETDWELRDDASNRIVEFISLAWPREHLEENLKFIADSLGPNNGEQPRETIRRYSATAFYKHHLSMYKKRPIYWLFSSGKLRAFQCLVYLHRYHEGTLARMRTEYVIPLQGKIAAQLEQLTTAIPLASSTSQRKILEKKRDMFLKQQTELRAFDEKLRHYADQRITLDLDDGVKVNYGRFGDLLADVKAVAGGTDED